MIARLDSPRFSGTGALVLLLLAELCLALKSKIEKGFIMDLMAPGTMTSTGKAAADSGLWTKFSNYLGSDSFANFGKGIQGVGAIASIGTNIYGLFQSNKALKMQKKALENAEKQQAIENARYDKREKERDEATQMVMAGADILDTSRV